MNDNFQDFLTGDKDEFTGFSSDLDDEDETLNPKKVGGEDFDTDTDDIDDDDTDDDFNDDTSSRY